MFDQSYLRLQQDTSLNISS